MNRYDGNLRLHAAPPLWSKRFDAHLAGCVVKASNAFGTLYCETPTGNFALFDPDILETEDLGISFSKGMSMIDEDVGLIQQDLYDEAKRRLGAIGDDEIYSFTVERVLGGAETVENLEIRPADAHFAKVLHVAEQVKDDPVGTVYTGIEIKRR